MPMVGHSSEDQGQSEDDQAEIEAWDGQGQMSTDLLGVRKWKYVPGRSRDGPYRRRVFPAGCVPGATDGSMPVGSAVSRERNKRAALYFFTFSSLLVLLHQAPNGCIGYLGHPFKK